MDKTMVPQVRVRLLDANLGYTSNVCEGVRINCSEAQAHVSAEGARTWGTALGEVSIDSFTLILCRTPSNTLAT